MHNLSSIYVSNKLVFSYIDGKYELILLYWTFICAFYSCVLSHKFAIFGGININKDILYWKSFYYTILYNFKYISVLEVHVRILLFMKNTNLSFPHCRKTTASRSFYYYVFKTDHRFSTTHFQVLFINLHIVLICLIFLSVI